MAAPQNQAAWLHEAGTTLKVGEAPLPTAGPGEIIVKNTAVAVAPLDNHIQDIGIFVQQWPSTLGSDVAGEVYEVGEGVTRFKKGDRVIGHAISFVSGRPQDGAFALYTAILADKAAILPDTISFKDGVVLPMAIEAVVTALSLKVPGEALPGVPTPAPGLPFPSLDNSVSSANKTLVVYGGSSSVGLTAIQLATAAGIHVIAITSARNSGLSKDAGAAEVFDYKDTSLVERVVEAVKATNNGFAGILDAISTDETFPHDLAILEKLGGGHLACSHPPPKELPANVKGGMFFGVNDIATPVWNDFVTPALASGKLQCLPKPTVVGKGLEFVDEALQKLKAGVSATKLVVEL